MARNLLEKLSRQIQVMETLAAVSDENIGNIGSVVEGEPPRGTPSAGRRPARARLFAALPGPVAEKPSWARVRGVCTPVWFH